MTIEYDKQLKICGIDNDNDWIKIFGKPEKIIMKCEYCNEDIFKCDC